MRIYSDCDMFLDYFPKQYPAWDTVRMYSESLEVRPSFFRREQMKLTTLPAPYARSSPHTRA